MRTRRNIIVLICFLPLMLQAEVLLTELYARRMKAEREYPADSLEVIDLALAEAYLKRGSLDLTRRFLESSLLYASEENKNERRMDIYRLDMLEGNFNRAESGLLSLYYFSEYEDQRSRAAMLLGIVKALDGKYEQSAAYLTESYALRGISTEELEGALDSLLADTKKLKRPETAKWMSAFLPGAGQLYAKNYKGAAGAVGMAVFWGGWFAYDLLQKDYYSAALVLFWPWQRYHRGNIQNAEYSVEAYNLRIEDRINRILLDYLSSKE